MSREHGRVKYVAEACRCEVCTTGQRDYERERRARVVPAYVGADRARQHVRWLSENGVGLKQIVKVCGVSQGALWKLMYGDPKRAGGRPSKRIRRETEAAILSVMPDQGAAGARVPSGPTLAHVETLLARGWSKAAIGKYVHGPNARTLQVGGQYVTRKTARIVEGLLEQPVEERMSRHGTPMRRLEVKDAQEELRDEARREHERTRRARYRDTDPEIDAEAHANHIDLHPLPEGIDLSWRQDGTCRRPEYPTWLFFPTRGDTKTVAAAKEVCARCPVIEPCLEFALLTNADGIWAGTSEKQRRPLRKQVAA